MLRNLHLPSLKDFPSLPRKRRRKLPVNEKQFPSWIPITITILQFRWAMRDWNQNLKRKRKGRFNWKRDPKKRAGSCSRLVTMPKTIQRHKSILRQDMWVLALGNSYSSSNTQVYETIGDRWPPSMGSACSVDTRISDVHLWDSGCLVVYASIRVQYTPCQPQRMSDEIN